jgi:hypothetical protein
VIGNLMLDIVLTQQQVTVQIYPQMGENRLTVWVVAPNGSRQSKTLRDGFDGTWQLR